MELHILLYLYEKILADALHDDPVEPGLNGDVGADDHGCDHVLQLLLVLARLYQWPPLGGLGLPVLLLATLRPGVCGILVVGALEVIRNAGGVVVLAVGPEIRLVEDDLYGVVGEPVDQVLRLQELGVRGDGLALALRHHLLALQVALLLLALALGPHLRLGHSADGGQARHVVHPYARVLHLVLPLQDVPLRLLLFLLLLLLTPIAVALVGQGKGILRVRHLALGALLVQLLARLAASTVWVRLVVVAVGQVVHLLRARLPESHPALLSGHDPGVLCRPVAIAPGALADEGILLAAQQQRAKEHRMVL
mmetsp:Transcript_79937/g.246569  ORF Transcript_79937/g.246569 Transcript_79937/m.246569 type:complete len:309 (+) Transcript_79937:766-1692(+)